MILFPPKKQKKTKILSKQLTVLNPNLPIYLQLFWLVCVFCFSKVPRGDLFFFGQFCFRPREAPSCPETAAGWPRSCTFFSTRKNLSQKLGFRPKKTWKGFFAPPQKKNSQQIKEMQMGCLIFFGTPDWFFFVKNGMLTETQSHGGLVGRWFCWNSICSVMF